MRIMLVNTYYYPEIKGGAEYSVKYLAEALASRGHQVAVLCTGNFDKTEIVNNVIVKRIKSRCICRSDSCGEKNFILRKAHRILDVYNPWNSNVVRNYLLEFAPDVIHTNGLYDISPIIWKTAKQFGVSIVHTLRDYYLICTHGTLLKIGSSEVCSKCKIGCSIYRTINIHFSKLVDCVTAPSRFTLDVVTSCGLFGEADKQWVPNAIPYNNNELKTSTLRQLNNSDKTFVFSGTLAEHKGIKWLIDSFEIVKDPSLKLLVFGRGPLQDYVESACRRDPRIQFMGFLNQSQLLNEMNNAYCLICPSIWNEPFGRVVLDAYKCGLPVIASDMGALPDIVRPNITGLLVAHGDTEALADAIRQMAYDERFRNSLISNIEISIKTYSIENQCESFERIYEGLRLHDQGTYCKVHQ